ncbi:MAG: hypothetical protein ACWGQW_21760 [bacterium]
MKGILLLPILFAACSTFPLDPESRTDRTCVVPVEVNPGLFDRFDKPVTVKLDLTDPSGQRDSTLPLDEASLGVTEVDQHGNTINDSVLFQFDPDPSRKAGECYSGVLTFLMDGTSLKGMLRRFRVQIGPAETTPFQPAVQEQVVFDSVQHGGFESFHFTTNSGSYFYHIRGSAFASIVDRDGNDWISYKPEGGAEGSYRGIPNIAPAGFHPGPGETNRLSLILASGPLRAEIRSESEDGKWACTWEIFPSYATMTLDRKGDESYWMLYEGTPGGRFTVDDYWVDSSGRRFDSRPWTSKNKWNGDLPEPEWVYFGDPELDRVLFLAHHEYSEEIDEYWHFGDGGMTVFGFGRGPREVAWQRLKRVPARLTVGFAESKEFSEVRKSVCSAYKPLEVKVGELMVIK